MKLKGGFGYWDTTSYPIGGSFKRAPRDTGLEFEPFEVIAPMYKGCDIKGMTADGRTLACAKEHCE